MYLNGEDKAKDIFLYVNSLGGAAVSSDTRISRMMVLSLPTDRRGLNGEDKAKDFFLYVNSLGGATVCSDMRISRMMVLSLPTD